MVGEGSVWEKVVAEIPEYPISDFKHTNEGLVDQEGNLWITPAQISDMAGNTAEAVRTAIKRGSLPSIRVTLHMQHFFYAKKSEAVAWIAEKPRHTRKRKGRASKTE